MSGYAGSSTKRIASPERLVRIIRAAPVQKFRIERVRTASSAVCPEVSRQRVNRNSSSLERMRTQFTVRPGFFGAYPSRFERLAALLLVRPACVPAQPGAVVLFRTSDGQWLAAMRPKELSCRKDWLFPQPPTNEGSRSSRKVN